MESKPRIPPVLLLLALAALAYWPALQCGFIWDDDDYVTQNPVLRTVGGIWRIWFEPTSLPQYYPLVHTTFWLEYRLWGDHPLGYHLVNVALHLGSSLVLLRVLRRLAIPGALFGAALLLVHPVHVESVAWVTERKNVLSLLCMLLAAQQWLRWHDDGGSRRSWWGATAWFCAALLSKTVVAPLPAALLVVQWWRRGSITRREVLSLVPWLALGIAFGLFTVWLEAVHVGASGAVWQLQGGERLLVSGRAVWFYLGSLIWPAGICFNYPRWQLDSASLVQWLPTLAALLALGGAVLMRRRIGRAPAAAMMLFGGMLVPALGFFDVYPFRYSYVADHFQYHASVAMLVALAAGATLLARRRLAVGIATGLAAVVLTGLAIYSSVLVHNYKDLETSWRRTLETNPRSMLALINLGGLLLERGELDGAQMYFDRCLAMYPDNYESLGNLGSIAHRRRDLVTARRHYEASLAIRGDNAGVLNNFALLEQREGHSEKALQLARYAVELAPDMMAARRTYAQVAAHQGKWQECVEQVNWVVARTPAAHEIRLLGARGLLELGQVEPAIQNAAFILARVPNLTQAQQVMARALARLLAAQPVSALAAKVAQVCRSAGIDPAPLLPLMAAEFRALGDPARAAVLQR